MLPARISRIAALVQVESGAAEKGSNGGAPGEDQNSDTRIFSHRGCIASSREACRSSYCSLD